MVAAQEEQVLRVLDFEGKQQADRLQGSLSSEKEEVGMSTSNILLVLWLIAT